MKPAEHPGTGSIILSPTPVGGEDREAFAAFAPPPLSFLDLAGLRRNGLKGTWRTLRGSRAACAIVTGSGDELAVFQDILGLLALLVPARQRLCWRPGGEAEPLRHRLVPVLVGRIVLGVCCGFVALVAVLLRLWRWSGPGRRLTAIPGKPSKCLYLKPTLMFGAAVGGSIGHVAGVANALSRLGQSVRLLSVSLQPLVNSTIRQVSVQPPTMMTYPYELNLFRYHRKFAGEAERQARDFRPNYIYQRYSLNDLSGALLRGRLGIPLVLEFNGSETWIQKHWGRALRFQSISERIELANLKHADLVVVVSDEIKRQVCAAGIPEDKVLFYPNCVDTSVFDPSRFDRATTLEIRRGLNVPEDADLFTFVGTFGRWHGTDVLADAIRMLIDRERSFLDEHHIHFLFVGEGLYGGHVREVLGKRDDQAYVTFAGRRSQHEAPGILAASDVFLSPHVPNPDGSRFFGSPMKLFEYMAMGKPIIASDLDQIGQVLRGWEPGLQMPVSAGHTGAGAILVEPGSLDSLAVAVCRAAVMSPEERRKLGDLALKYVRRSFTWDRNVEAVMEAFGRRPKKEATPGTEE